MARGQYERAYGSKYSELGGYQTASVIAKLMRADIKAAINAGELPGTMANYSVRVRNYSGGRSIDMEAIGMADELYEQCVSDFCRNPWCKSGGENKDSEHATYHETLTAEGGRIKTVLQKIHDAYNYDGSDVQTDYFDVNYYGHAEIEDASSARFQVSEKARKAAIKARKAAA